MPVLFSGGVSSNSHLNKRMSEKYGAVFHSESVKPYDSKYSVSDTEQLQYQKCKCRLGGYPKCVRQNGNGSGRNFAYHHCVSVCTGELCKGYYIRRCERIVRTEEMKCLIYIMLQNGEIIKIAEQTSVVPHSFFILKLHLF